MTQEDQSPAPRSKPRHFEWRVALMYLTLFAPLGIHLPYFPLWLEARGFDAEEIAVVLAAPMLLRVFTTPLISTLADRARDRANVLLATVVLTFLISLAYFGAHSFAAVMAASLLLSVPWAPQPPLADSIALSGVRRFGSNYAHMRIWGSAAFLATSFAGGFLISTYGAQVILLMISGGLLVAIAPAFAMPRLGKVERSAPTHALQGAGARARWSRYFILCVTGAGLINASHGFMFGFASIYWKAIGIDESAFGLLWSAAVVSEVAMFMAFTRIFRRVSTPALLMLAGLGAVIRWIAYPLIDPLGLGVPGFIAVQALHSFSTALILLGVQKLIAEEISDEKTGAAQGVAYFANGFSMALVTFASGTIYQTLGATGFFVMAGVAGLGAALVCAGALSPPERRLRR